MSRESTLAQFESILAEGQIACVSQYMQPQESRISRAKTSSPCMRFERCARERACSLQDMQVPPSCWLLSPMRSHPAGPESNFLCVSQYRQAPVPPRLDHLSVHIQHTCKRLIMHLGMYASHPFRRPMIVCASTSSRPSNIFLMLAFSCLLGSPESTPINTRCIHARPEPSPVCQGPDKVRLDEIRPKFFA